MRVSIIVPVLNRERLILRCLDSIGAQTMLPAEIIVVDNGSDDNTLEVVNKWKENFYLHCDKEASKVDIKILEEPERGVCAARQRGLEESTGDLLYFFDSDDAMDKNLIAKAYEEFCSKEEPDLVCWQCRIHLLDGKVKVPHFQWHNSMESHLIDTLLRTQGYMIKRNFLLKAGGWNKRLPVWNDMELGARILLNHPSIKGIPRILADIYSQKQSITGTAFSLREGEWEYSLDMIRKDAAEAGHPSQHKIVE